MKFLDDDDLDERLGPRSKVQRWRDAKNDLFPLPVKVGNRNRFADDEIKSYQRWRIAVRDGTTKIKRWSEWCKAERETVASSSGGQAQI
jgi:hypothetical protein